MTTPHARGVSAHLLGLKWSIVDPPEHLQLFSIAGLKKMLTENGFCSARVVTEGFNSYELLQDCGIVCFNLRTSVPPIPEWKRLSVKRSPNGKSLTPFFEVCREQSVESKSTG
jgi:hypothetical protein